MLCGMHFPDNFPSFPSLSRKEVGLLVASRLETGISVALCCMTTTFKGVRRFTSVHGGPGTTQPVVIGACSMVTSHLSRSVR